MKKFRIGLETDFLSGPMTGVGNYCLHILNALMDDDDSFQFIGFSRLAWSALDWAKLRELTRMHDKLSTAEEATRAKIGSGQKAYLTIRMGLARIELARSIYARLRAYRFSRDGGRNSLDLFHAFRFVPPGDLEIPILPVVYDLSFVRYPETHPKERLRELERLPDVIRKSRIVQTISEFSKREICEIYGCSPEKVVVAAPAAAAIFRPLGIDATCADIAPKGLTFHGYLLTVGTLEPRKNLKTLIAAYARLPAKVRQDSPLVVVGHKGWGNLALPKEADQMVRDGTLRFLGSVSDSELRSLYEGAIALLVPSVYEGFGMPVVEAFACGTPVIHSSNSSMDDITDGRSLRVSATDIDAWTVAIAQLLDNPISATLGREERVARAQEYSWRESGRAVKKIYDQLLS
jgi:glycosyltransferase involved in cell wall biosynthesis